MMDGMNEAAIHAILSRFLLAGGLPGGTKLGEHRLAEIFGVSRERIRKVLHRLGHERLLEIVKNRGAFTIEPDLREGRVVYEARRILESGMVAHLADNLTEAQIARLREHVDAEADAMRRGDQPTWLRLSGEFHFLLADMIGNPIVQRQANELISRTMRLRGASRHLQGPGGGRAQQGRQGDEQPPLPGRDAAAADRLRRCEPADRDDAGGGHRDVPCGPGRCRL
jgi:DNA-binding GntR family transcriptional regulator